MRVHIIGDLEGVSGIVKWEAVDKLRRHGVEVKGDRRVVSRADDWWTAWQQFFF